MIARGEVWLANLDRGREDVASGHCLVVSPAELHDFLDVVLVAPVVTGRRSATFRADVRFNNERARILLDQVTALDKARLIRRLGALEPDDMSATLAILRDMFAE
jgi:mRNA interferase MazF